MEEPSSSAQVEGFETWLKANPAHLEAYQEIDKLADKGARLPSSSRYPARSEVVVRRYSPAFAIAAAIVFAIGLWGLLRDPSPAYAAVSNRGQATRIVGLSDGSIVTLDTATMLEVAVAPAAHHVKMSSGRARFVVRLSADKPLRVTAAAGEVTSANGVFDVAVDDNEVRVWVISGKAVVAVAATNGNAAPRSLGAGQGARMQAGAASAAPIEHPDTTWPAAHVAFDQTPLASILAIANRGDGPKISVADDAAGNLRVTGVMDLRDTQKLARKLAAALDLKLTESDGTLLLSR